jgi:hypothetical protein
MRRLPGPISTVNALPDHTLEVCSGGAPPLPTTSSHRPAHDRESKWEHLASLRPREYALVNATYKKHGAYEPNLLNGDGTRTATGNHARAWDLMRGGR